MSELPEIHKFGGSCLRDAGDINRIAEVILNSQNTCIIVVSALWGTTDRLMRAAKEPRYAGRLVNDLASQHLRFAPNLIDSPLHDTFQMVLTGIEDALEIRQRTKRTKWPITDCSLRGNVFPPLSLLSRSANMELMPTRWVLKTSAFV